MNKKAYNKSAGAMKNHRRHFLAQIETNGPKKKHIVTKGPLQQYIKFKKYKTGKTFQYSIIIQEKHIMQLVS